MISHFKYFRIRLAASPPEISKIALILGDSKNWCSSNALSFAFEMESGDDSKINFVNRPGNPGEQFM
jgi:hypothetical protein